MIKVSHLTKGDKMKITSIVLCGLLLGTPVLAHEGHRPVSITPVGVSQIGSAKMTTLDLEIEVNNDNGQAFFFEVASNKEEQLINQGYAALNVFQYVDAYRSFKTAYSLNADSVFALVGMNFSVLNQDTSANGARLAAAALNQAYKVSQMRELSEKEAAWLSFSKAFYAMNIGNTSMLDDKSPVDLNASFQNLAAVDGNNLEFRAYVHWNLLNNSNFQYIQQVLENVLTIEPDHAGANHYLLHIAEMVDDIPTAQRYGEHLITLALGSGHAQHMYGHTLPQTGEWEKALEQFLIADKIHQDWAAKNGVEISEDWHYAHNLDLMAATYLGLGDIDQALSNWSTAMQFDARAIQKMIGLALASNKLAVAQNALTQIEALGPQYRNFVAPLRSEEKFYSSNVVPTNFSQDQFGTLLRKTFRRTTLEQVLANEYEQYFTAKFRSGGFDGWSNGFVELLRAKNIANKLGLSVVEAKLVDLELKAKSGEK